MITQRYPKWPVVLVLIVGAVVFAVGVGVQWVRLRALSTIQTIAETTGRTITVGRVVLDPRGHIRIDDLRISAPGDPSLESLAFQSLQATIDPFQALEGARMPREIHVAGLRADLNMDKDSTGGFDDLVQAVKSLRKRATPSTEPKADIFRRLPSLILTDVFVRVRFGDWRAVGQGELHWTTDANQTKVLATGLVDTGNQSSFVRLEGTRPFENESATDIQLHLDPPVSLPPHPLLSGRSVTLGELRFLDGGAIELASVHIEDPGSDDTQLGLKSIEIRPRRTGAKFDLDSVGYISAKGLHLRKNGQSLAADTLELHLAEPGTDAPNDTLDRLLYRLTQVQCTACEGTGFLSTGTVATQRAEIHLDRWRKSDPIRGIRKLHVDHPKLALVTDFASEGDDTLGNLLRTDTEEAQQDIQPPPLDDIPPAPKSRKDPATVETPKATPKTQIPTLPPQWIQALRDIDLNVNNGDLSVKGKHDGATLLRLSGIDFRVDRDDSSAGLKFTVSASLEEDKEQTAALNLSGVVDGTGRVLALDIKSAGSRLAQMLAGSSSKIRANRDAELGLDVTVRPTSDSAYRIEGAFSSKNIGFEWWRIASDPIDGFEMSAAFTADFDPLTDTFTLVVPELSIGRLKFEAKFAAVGLQSTPNVDLQVKMPVQPCQHVFDSVPRALMPRLQGIRAAGTTWFDLQVKLDMNDPYGMKLDLDGDLESCVITDMGPDIDIDKLNRRTFVHTPVVQGQELNVRVGPGTRSWISLSNLPTYVPWGAVATEDLDFYNHKGFKLSLIKRAIKMDLDHRRYVYGGSTISQQLVKNLFLSREKTLARKWEEAIITWRMEQVTTKDRILELYLNCIEYGPEIYGIKAAAQHYFGKPPQELTPLETSFLMGLKPCPSCGYRQWKKRTTEKYWQDRLQFIMKRLRDRGWITQEQFDAEQDYRLNFYYPGEGRLFPETPLVAPESDEIPPGDSKEPSPPDVAPTNPPE